jgi:tellurite resistance protein TerC
MFLDLLADVDLSSIFTLQAAYVVAALVVIEGLLSVDNALAIAALASHLDDKKRKVAMTIGYAGAYGFRILALFLAGVIVDNHYLMALGAAYLIWLMCNHFAEHEDAEEHGDAEGKPQHSFAKTIAMIAFLDLSLSFDNVVAAVAFARDNIYLVYLGVTIGIITLRMVAGYCIKLLEKYPWLEHTAFLLVGFVGFLLCTELYWDTTIQSELSLWGYALIHADQGHYHIQKAVKFGGIFAIILGHLAYENVPGVRPVVLPFAILFRHIFALVARAINFIFMTLTWPVRMLFRALFPKRPSNRPAAKTLV